MNTSAQLPIYAITDAAGTSVALVLSLGTFSPDGEHHLERITPAVRDALDRAQALHGEECLYAFYLRDGSPTDTVRRVRHALQRTFMAQRRVLWLRADTEELLRAALAIACADYHASAGLPARDADPAESTA
jgi:predicted nicotinamide N-methyase